jgi:hypothetical protein
MLSEPDQDNLEKLSNLKNLETRQPEKLEKSEEKNRRNRRFLQHGSINHPGTEYSCCLNRKNIIVSVSTQVVSMYQSLCPSGSKLSDGSPSVDLFVAPLDLSLVLIKRQFKWIPLALRLVSLLVTASVKIPLWWVTLHNVGNTLKTTLHTHKNPSTFQKDIPRPG